MEINELKTLIEDGNKTIHAIREEVESVKSNDSLSEQKMAKMEADLAKVLEQKSELEGKLTAIETKLNRPNFTMNTKESDAHRDAFISYLRDSTNHEAKSALMEIEKKSVNISGTGQNGGYAVPSVIANDIAEVAQNYGAIRRLARVVSVGTSDYVELVSAGTAGFQWVGDLSTRNVTANPTLTRVKPVFGEISARVEVTNQALEDMFFDVQAWVTNELAQKFSVAEGAAFVTGNGTDKPVGILAATSGLSEVDTGSATDLGTDPYDTLIDLVYGLKGEYRLNGKFIMNSATLAQLVKVKDSNGNYIYNPAIAQGVASTLLGYEVHTDENMPDIAAYSLPVAFGDFSRGYLIADRIGISTLVNPYKTSGIVEIEARKRVGGIVKDANAIKLLKVAV